MAERGRGPGEFTLACGAGRAVVQTWHDAQCVERDRYAGLLAAGVTDAATLETPAPVPACSACGGGEGDATGASGLVGGP